MYPGCAVEDRGADLHRVQILLVLTTRVLHVRHPVVMVTETTQKCKNAPFFVDDLKQVCCLFGFLMLRHFHY